MRVDHETARDRGLNPFFIRSIVQSHQHINGGGWVGLNPFFIRSIVQSRVSDHAIVTGES